MPFAFMPVSGLQSAHKCCSELESRVHTVAKTDMLAKTCILGLQLVRCKCRDQDCQSLAVLKRQKLNAGDISVLRQAIRIRLVLL